MTVGQKILRFFQTRVFRTALLLISLLIIAGVVRSVVTIAQKRGIVEQRKAVLRQEENTRAELERKLKEATSAAFIERVAREKLGLVKEGEVVVILDKSKLQSGPQTTSPVEIPSWKQWWQLFF